ncbi:unnamed protein product [Citrullus colocynthis]|uniref:Uncharacterized protein n=1 Tax=Citrullus colocynthis TaxID=252529 RepID=A0ABP0YCG6_9ROSI
MFNNARWASCLLNQSSGRGILNFTLPIAKSTVPLLLFSLSLSLPLPLSLSLSLTSQTWEREEQHRGGRETKKRTSSFR